MTIQSDPDPFTRSYMWEALALCSSLWPSLARLSIDWNSRLGCRRSARSKPPAVVWCCTRLSVAGAMKLTASVAPGGGDAFGEPRFTIPCREKVLLRKAFEAGGRGLILFPSFCWLLSNAAWSRYLEICPLEIATQEMNRHEYAQHASLIDTLYCILSHLKSLSASAFLALALRVMPTIASFPVKVVDRNCCGVGVTPFMTLPEGDGSRDFTIWPPVRVGVAVEWEASVAALWDDCPKETEKLGLRINRAFWSWRWRK